MSEIASRSSASRGRGSGRGGRGGFAGRGGRRTNGQADNQAADASNSAFDDDEGDIGELRKQYGSKTGVIREMFPDWSEVDVLFALQETNGDENEAVTRIAEGTPPAPTSTFCHSVACNIECLLSTSPVPLSNILFLPLVCKNNADCIF